MPKETASPGYTFDDNTASPVEYGAWKFEAAKSAVTLALRCVYELMEPMGKHLDIFVKPVAVRPSVNIKAGQLMLAPATTHVVRKGSPSSLCVGKYDLGGEKLEQLFISPMFTAPLAADGSVNKAPFVCPFWQLACSQTKKDANMQLKVFPYTVADIKVRVPILVNTKDIEASEELLWDKTSAPGFSSVRSEVSGKDYEQAAKRRKLK